MEFGITMFPTDRTILPTRLGQLVEEAGFDALFLPEHSHVPLDRSSPYPSGGELPEDFYRFHDPIESLAAIAAVTRRIVLGTSTLVLPNHDPITLAKRLSTLDHLCGGRLVVGIGAGWNMQEIANHGRDPGRRFTAMREIAEALKAIWTEDEAAFQGQVIRFEALRQWPKPVQRPHPPIYVGGAGPRVAARVVRYGDGWLPSGRHLDGDELSRRIDELQRLAAEHGRGRIPVSFHQGTASRDAIERYLTMELIRVVFRVEPNDEAQIVDQLGQLAELVAPYRDPDQQHRSIG